MAEINRINGGVSAASFYGYPFKVIQIAATGKFTADTVNGTTLAITEGGYSKAIKAVSQVASIIVVGAQADDNFAVIVDGSTYNNGPGANTDAVNGALKDALISASGGIASDYTVQIATALNGAGTFNLA